MTNDTYMMDKVPALVEIIMYEQLNNTISSLYVGGTEYIIKMCSLEYWYMK